MLDVVSRHRSHFARHPAIASRHQTVSAQTLSATEARGSKREILTLAAKGFTENMQATNAEATDSDCRLLEFPDLTLSLIWNHVRELPMRNRCALLATCKKALSTFAGLTDRMERLQLTLLEATPKPDGSSRQNAAAHPQLGASSGGHHAFKVLSWFPGTLCVGRLELQFSVGCAGSPSLRSFAFGASMWLTRITNLELNASNSKVRATCKFIQTKYQLMEVTISTTMPTIPTVATCISVCHRLLDVISTHNFAVSYSILCRRGCHPLEYPPGI